jgi:hypothetical protein
MGLSIIKSFSILVASGNGQKCNQMRSVLKECLLMEDSETGLSKIFLHKNCKKDPLLSEHCLRVSKEVGKVVKEVLLDIPDHFYGPDQKINILELN